MEMSFFVLCPWNKVSCLDPDNRDLSPLGPEPVKSPSAVRHVDELMSSRSEPNGLQVERLEAEGQRDNTIIRSAYQIPIIRATPVHV